MPIEPVQSKTRSSEKERSRPWDVSSCDSDRCFCSVWAVESDPRHFCSLEDVQLMVSSLEEISSDMSNGEIVQSFIFTILTVLVCLWLLPVALVSYFFGKFLYRQLVFEVDGYLGPEPK